MPAANPPESCLDLLRAMVGFDTVTPRTSGRADAEAQLGEYVARLATGWGLAVEALPVAGAAPNVLVTLQLHRDAPWLLFDSHLDTVGAASMSIDPFAAEVRDGRVYGRGTCDTKGPGAAMLWAMKEVAEHKSASANLALLFTVGEEALQVGARAFLQHDLPRLAWRPHAVVVSEPTGMDVIRATNGYVRFNLVTTGRAAHSSSPEKGHNAVSDMARAIVAVEDGYIAGLNATHPLTGRSTCSINVIRGGVEHNVVPDRCVATVDHRLVPGQSAESALGGVREALAKIAASAGEFDCQIADIENAPAFAPDLNQGVSQWACERLQSRDIASVIRGAPYTTNANHYAAEGLAAIVLGPGDIAQAHTRDEWIAIDQLSTGVRGYREMMEGPLPPGSAEST